VIISLNTRVIIANISIRFAPRAGSDFIENAIFTFGGAGGGDGGAAAGDPAGGLLGYAGVPGTAGGTGARRQEPERISD
jgi:hypothetical protein